MYSIVTNTVVPLPSTTMTNQSISTSHQDIFEELKIDLNKEANEFHTTLIDRLKQIEKADHSRSPLRSQHLLSSTVSHTILNDDSLIAFDQIPALFATSNVFFRKMFLNWLPHVMARLDSNQLEQMTLCIYKRHLLQLRQTLWQTYLQSGTGEIPLSDIRQQRYPKPIVYVWPLELSLLVLTYSGSPIKHRHDLNDETHVQFVKKHLAYLDDQYHQILTQYELMNKETNYNFTMVHQQIETFIKNQILPVLTFYFDARIELLKAAYIDQFLQFEYLQQKSTQEQIDLAHHLIQLTLNKEKAVQDYHILQSGISEKRYLSILSMFNETTLPKSILTIRNTDKRDRLSNDFHQILNRTKTDTAQLVLQAAMIHRDDYQSELNVETKKIWNEQRHLPLDRRLSTLMITIIEERQKNITLSIQRLYTLKTQMFRRISELLFDAPTSMI